MDLTNIDRLLASLFIFLLVFLAVAYGQFVRDLMRYDNSTWKALGGPLFFKPTPPGYQLKLIQYILIRGYAGLNCRRIVIVGDCLSVGMIIGFVVGTYLLLSSNPTTRSWLHDFAQMIKQTFA